MAEHEMELAQVEHGEGTEGCASAPADDPQVPPGFAVRDAESANWVCKKINEARAYRATVRAWAEREMRRAEREENALLFLFGTQVERWAKAEIEKLGGRRRSIRLPGGNLGFRTLSPSLVVDDDKLVIDW